MDRKFRQVVLFLSLPLSAILFLDLAIFLPLFLITEILLIPKHSSGPNLAACFLLTTLVLHSLQENNPATRGVFSRMAFMTFLLVNYTQRRIRTSN